MKTIKKTAAAEKIEIATGKVIENLYASESSIEALLRKTRLSGVGLKKSTVAGGGTYPVPSLLKGTPIVVRFLSLLGAISESKPYSEKVAAEYFVKGLSLFVKSPAGSPIGKIYSEELRKIGRPYNNFNRVTSELRARVNRGEILSFSFAESKPESEELFGKLKTALSAK